jgi:seipin
MGRGKMMSGLDFEGPPRIGNSGVGSLLLNSVQTGINASKVRLGGVAAKTKDATSGLALKTRKAMYSLLSVLLTFFFILSASLFLYGTFYYAFMPKEIHEVEVNFQFDPCEDRVGVCSFPNASIDFQTKKNGLMTGQPYSINLLLEVPDSPQNQDMGMFMSCIHIMGTEGKSIKDHCKSDILEYRSDLLRVLDTVVFSPFLMLGSTSQRQWININYLTDFMDDPHSPTQNINIQLRSRFVQVYSASLQVHAEFTGLRSIMYHHPWLSSFIGVLSNMILLSCIILMSWARFVTEKVPGENMEEEEEVEGDMGGEDEEATKGHNKDE